MQWGQRRRVGARWARAWLQGAGGARVACWVGAQQTVKGDPEVDVERGRPWAWGGEGEARGQAALREIPGGFEAAVFHFLGLLGQIATNWVVHSRRHLFSPGLEARNLKSRCRHGRAPSTGSRVGPSWLPPPSVTPGAPWPQPCHCCLTGPSSCVSGSLFLSLIRTLSWTGGPP